MTGLTKRCSLVFLAALLSLCALWGHAANADDSYYYAGGKRHSLPASTNWLAVQLDEGGQAATVSAAVKARGALDTSRAVRKLPRFNLAVVPLQNTESVAARSTVRNSTAGVAGVKRVLRTFGNGKSPIIETDELVVQFKPGTDKKEAATLLAKHGAALVEQLGPYAPNGYRARVVNPALTAAAVANALYESGVTLFSHPNFIWPKQKRYIPNDTLFPDQWYLRNTTRDGQGRDNTGQDISIEKAWDISRGNPNIKIAILDDGFDLTHEDLAANMLPGFDFTDSDDNVSDTDTSPGPYDFHGTSCAGLAAGVGNNGKGISGAAPLCKIIPVRMLGDQATLQDEADAFRFAADRGADIISNSWGPDDGQGVSQPLPDVTKAAIDYAATSGRGGKGCVIFFASGNGNESADLDGYASYSRVISVAASTVSGERAASYSDYGASVDLNAPGGSGDMVVVDNTDVPGHPELNGKATGKYYTQFSGTSAAAPLAAGVAALVLSVDPSLTNVQVQDLLQSTADKNGGDVYDSNGHSDEYGYGRVNALRALQGLGFSVSGRVTAGAAGVAGVTITATSGASTVTDANGNYTLKTAGLGATTITPSRTNTVFTPASKPLNLTENATGVNFTAVNYDITLVAPANGSTVGGNVGFIGRTNPNDATKMDFEYRTAPFTQAVTPNLVIPDTPNDEPTSVVSNLPVSKTGLAQTVSVTLDVTHPYVTDLRITLISPNGQQYVLHNRVTNSQGESANLKQTYNDVPLGATLPPINGTWQLKVEDLDYDGVNPNPPVSTLNSWSISFDPKWAVAASDTNGATAGDWAATWNALSLPTGAYQVRARAFISGQNFVSAVNNITLDSTNPVVAFTAPASGASLTTLPAVSGTATDDASVAAVTFRLQRASDSKFWTGSAWGASTELTTTLSGAVNNRTWTRTTALPTGANLTPGNYTLTATATDGSARIGTATRGFTVATPNSPPAIAFTAPAADASLTALPAVSGTATDDVAVTKVTLRIQRASDSKFWTGAAWGVSTELTTSLTSAVNNRTWTRNSDLPFGGNLAPGSYTLTATATDGGGLTGTATRSFTVPTPSAPTVAFTAPASGASLGSLTTVSGTVTDALGISGVTFRLQRASDSKFWTGSAWGASTELTTTPAGTLTDGTWSRSADLPAGTDLLAGSYTLTATATNTSAVTATATRSFTVPVPTAPVVAFTAPAAGASLTSIPAVSGTATDGILVSSVTFRLQRGSDNKFWTGSAWGASTELTTTLSGAVTSRTWTRTTDLPFGANLVAGSYTLTATATNGSALIGTATQGFTVPVPATASAVVATVTTPINGSSIKALTLANGTVVDKTGGPGISKVDITLQRVSDLKFWNGTNWVVASTPLPTGVSGNVWTKGVFPAAGANPDTQLQEGKYIIAAKATNLNGVVSPDIPTSKTQFTVDRSVPTDLTIINPVFNGKLKGIPKLNGTVKDNLGVASVQLILQRSTDAKSWNGTTWVAAETLLATNVAGPVTDRVWSLSTGLPTGENLVLGTYALTAIATDYAGNKTTLPWRFVITEGDRPTITITSPANATTVSSLTTISGVAGDTGGSSLASVQLTLRRMSDNTYWKGSAWVPESSILPTQVTAVTAFNFNWVCTVMPKGADLLDGVYRAQATAFDRAGNISSIYQVQFTYKKAAALTRSSKVVLSSANAAGGEDGLIQLLFTGALAGSATDATNYGVTLDGEPVEVFSARQKSPGLIILTTDGLAAGSRIAVNYYLQDTSGGNVTGTANVTVK